MKLNSTYIYIYREVRVSETWEINYSGRRCTGACSQSLLLALKVNTGASLHHLAHEYATFIAFDVPSIHYTEKCTSAAHLIQVPQSLQIDFSESDPAR